VSRFFAGVFREALNNELLTGKEFELNYAIRYSYQ